MNDSEACRLGDIRHPESYATDLNANSVVSRPSEAKVPNMALFASHTTGIA
ncbi:hypothetical protein [Nitrosospira sp. Nsp14]|uniref:hypothetical protein n=1 Tax=Nitrosospira sp. Nsp14 TaxID=1855333 RepID=UPI0015A6DCC9|nr:hypothetical protein [Nitrosospira sp. Nsp14]